MATVLDNRSLSINVVNDAVHMDFNDEGNRPMHIETRLVLGDCIAEMQKIGDAAINVAITSPPYNLDIGYGVYEDDRPFDQYLEWTAQWMAQVRRILTTEGSFFLNLGGSPSDPWIPFDVAEVAREQGFILQNRILWVKSIHIQDGAGHTHGHVKPINSPRYLNSTHEFVFHFSKTGRVPLRRYDEGVGVPYVHPSNTTRWSHDRTRGCGGNTWHIPYETVQSKSERGCHPATFPVELPRRCLKLAGAEPGWVVLDPFGGIGTTAMACQELGVSSISMEIDESYLKTAAERLGVDCAGLAVNVPVPDGAYTHHGVPTTLKSPRDYWDSCPDCGCGVGEPHCDECDIERCSICGTQRISCGGCKGHDPIASAWTGGWPESLPKVEATPGVPG